ncbi:type II CAAX endopeptidase family protein [Lacibacter sp. H375]|uniref:CPBP family intramembrane glutamic endopeptidase n=1 Tax=Lacibacter sp. H375 TaxID=3133424 RepID=UPI0030C5854E
MQSSPIIKKGWLRALLFILVYMFLLILGNGGLGFVYGLLEMTYTTTVTFYGFILLNFLISFFTVWLFRKVFDKQSFKSLGLIWNGFGKERTAGVVTGILLLTVMATVLWLMKLLEWFVADINVAEFALTIIILVSVSFSEEVVFRGYILNNLMQSTSVLPALSISALLFAGFHSLNSHMSLIAFINIFIAGVLLGVNYIYTRNLWFAIFFHFTWNFVQGPVLGFEVSGLSLPSLLEQNLKGSVLLTGGAFGLEASWLTTFATSLMAIVLFFLFQRKYNSSVE